MMIRFGLSGSGVNINIELYQMYQHLKVTIQMT